MQIRIGSFGSVDSNERTGSSRDIEHGVGRVRGELAPRIDVEEHRREQGGVGEAS